MAFEDIIVALRDDEFGQLRREEAFEATDPAQFLNLVGNPRFEASVEFGDLFGALAQFAEEPRVLHGDDRLLREVLQQRDLLIAEWPHLLAIYPQHAQ